MFTKQLQMKTKEKAPTMERGSYSVPNMASIMGRESNGLRVVSTFSGCGGSCLGYRMAGFDVVWANEFIPIAADTYEANFPGTKVDRRDIRKIAATEILSACGLRKGELDLLDGSPPCDPFSMAGKRDKKWGKVKAYSETRQRTDDLTLEFVRVLRGLMPKAFIMENVSGLVKGRAIGYFKIIMRELKASGYKVSCRVLNAKYLDVPQSRERCIFVGVRGDLKAEPSHPRPLKRIWTIADALPWLAGGRQTTNRSFVERTHSADEPSVTITAGSGGKHGGSVIYGNSFTGKYSGKRKRKDPKKVPSPTIMSQTGGPSDKFLSGPLPPEPSDATRKELRGMKRGESGPKHFDIHLLSTNKPSPNVSAAHGGGGTTGLHVIDPDPPELGPAIRSEWDNTRVGESSKKYFSLNKPNPRKPSTTIQAAHGSATIASIVHPYEPRKLTILEAKRLCSFPDDFILLGSYAQQWERLGNSVPPMMMFHIAAHVRDNILLGGKDGHGEQGQEKRDNEGHPGEGHRPGAGAGGCDDKSAAPAREKK